MMDAPVSIPMPAKAALMPPTFEKLLAELIKRATLPDDPIRQEFHDGDIAHLKRWLDYGGANKTWQKICKGPFNSGDAFVFVMLVLRLRRAAEKVDVLNKGIAALEHEKKQIAPKVRKRAVRQLTNNEITPQQFAALNQRLQSTKFFDPLLTVRSDNKGSRRRSLFCRMLSDNLHYSTGQWHDAEVALLCEIALDCGDVTLEVVRSARRESTRKRRR
jgi:hypothetical protein